MAGHEAPVQQNFSNDQTREVAATSEPAHTPTFHDVMSDQRVDTSKAKTEPEHGTLDMVTGAIEGSQTETPSDSSAIGSLLIGADGDRLKAGLSELSSDPAKLNEAIKGMNESLNPDVTAKLTEDGQSLQIYRHNGRAALNYNLGTGEMTAVRSPEYGGDPGRNPLIKITGPGVKDGVDAVLKDIGAGAAAHKDLPAGPAKIDSVLRESTASAKDESTAEDLLSNPKDPWVVGGAPPEMIQENLKNRKAALSTMNEATAGSVSEQGRDTLAKAHGAILSGNVDAFQNIVDSIPAEKVNAFVNNLNQNLENSGAGISATAKDGKITVGNFDSHMAVDFPVKSQRPGDAPRVSDGFGIDPGFSGDEPVSYNVDEMFFRMGESVTHKVLGGKNRPAQQDTSF